MRLEAMGVALPSLGINVPVSYRDKAAAALAAIPAVALTVVIGSYDAGESPYGKASYVRSPSDGEYSAMPSRAKFTDALGAKWIIAEAVVHVDMMGAYRNSSTGSTAAFQAAVDVVKARQDVTPPAGGAAVPVSAQGISWAGGNYVVDGSVNMQSIVGFGWIVDGRGGSVRLTCSAKTGFDLLGSRWSTWYSPVIYGDATDSPAIGIQLGRLTATGAADGHVFITPQMDGVYTRASVYNLASETGLWVQPAIYNDDDTGDAAAFIIDGRNHWGATTDFTAPSMATDTAMSCIQHTFISPDIRNRGSGKAFWFTRIDQLKVFNGYAVSQDDAAALFLDDGSGFADIVFDVHCEQHTVAPGLQHNVYFDHVTNGGTTTVTGFKFHESWCAAAVSPIGVASHMGTITFVNSAVAIDEAGVAPSSGTLFNRTGVVFCGDLDLPASNIQVGAITVNGDISGRAIAGAVLPKGSVRVRDTGSRMHHKGGHLYWGNAATVTTAGDYATKSNVLLQDGKVFVRGDDSNIAQVVFTTGPTAETATAVIQVLQANGVFVVNVGGTNNFILRPDGQMSLPSLGADPASPVNGSIWNVGGVLRKRVGGVSSNVG